MAGFFQLFIEGVVSTAMGKGPYHLTNEREKKEALQKAEQEAARCQAVFDKHEAELSFIMKRAREQYALGVRKETGTFGDYTADFKYGDTDLPSRIDIYYPANAKTHGHIVIKNGVVDVWRDIDGTDILNGRGTCDVAGKT